MSDFPKYTFLDGAWHLIAEDETTDCGLVIPQGNGWVKEDAVDGKVHEPKAKKAEPVETPSDSVKATKPTAKATKDAKST